jgi:hypothetical protein
LGYGAWAQTPNPQSPIPNPQSPILFLMLFILFNEYNLILNKIYNFINLKNLLKFIYYCYKYEAYLNKY